MNSESQFKSAKTARKSAPKFRNPSVSPQWEYYSDFTVLLIMRYKCPFCNNTFKKRKYMLAHERYKHKRPKCQRGKRRILETV